MVNLYSDMRDGYLTSLDPADFEPKVVSCQTLEAVVRFNAPFSYCNHFLERLYCSAGRHCESEQYYRETDPEREQRDR